MSERELDAVIAAIEERDRLRQELAAARADAARLEWLAQHPLEGTIRIGGDLKPCTFWGVSSAGTDLRAAIDAALAAPESSL